VTKVVETRIQKWETECKNSN